MGNLLLFFIIGWLVGRWNIHLMIKNKVERWLE